MKRVERRTRRRALRRWLRRVSTSTRYDHLLHRYRYPDGSREWRVYYGITYERNGEVHREG